MSDRHLERAEIPDPLIEQIASRLREPVPLDPAARERVMQALLEEARPLGRRGTWSWLLRPKLVRIPPIGALAAAAVVMVAVAIAARSGVNDGATAVNRGASTATQASSVRDKLVNFVLVARSASSVALVGDFNSWDRSTTPLRASGAGVWSIAVPLTPGRHEYAFVVDGQRWVADPEAARTTADDFGAPSSVVLVAEGAQ